MTQYIASVSFGKDSLAMLHLLIERNLPLDEVVFYNTGAEFDCIYRERDRVMPLLAEHGIKYTELKPAEPFFYSMFARPINSKKNGLHYGYSWCRGGCRWGTTAKLSIIDKYKKRYDKYVEYIGIAVDEQHRIKDKRYPLFEAGITEAQALQMCYERGHEWLEDGVRLYDVLDRVSCWCCRNKNMKELKAIHDNLPRYWKRLQGLEATLGQMKSKPLSVIGGDVEGDN